MGSSTERLRICAKIQGTFTYCAAARGDFTVKIQQTAVGLALVLVVALSACGASSLPTPTTAASTTTTTTLTTTTTTTVAVSAVALVKSAAESLATARSVEVGSALSEGNGPTVQGAIRFFSNGSFAGDASVRIVGGPTVTTYFRVIGDREYVMAPSLLWIGLGYSATVARVNWRRAG